MHRHTVHSGESLYKIAKRHGTTVNNLLRKNPQFRWNPNMIYPGQKVRVW